MPDFRATAIAAVALQRLGDDKHRPVIREAVDYLVGVFGHDGTLSRKPGDEPDVVATVFGLEALRRSHVVSQLDTLLVPGREALLGFQSSVGEWQAEGWENGLLTSVVIEYLEGEATLLPQVDGYFLMARDFQRKAEELAHDGGLNDRRLAAVASVHAIEMFLYGLFEKKPDLGLSAYRTNLRETLGPRDALGALEKQLKALGFQAENRCLSFRQQIAALIDKRDAIVHHADDITRDQINAWLPSTRGFMEQYGAELLKLDLLQ